MASALLAFTYGAAQEQLYESTVVIEIGSYNPPNDEEQIFETVPDLYNALYLELVYRQQIDNQKLTLKSIQDVFLEINYISNNVEAISNLLNNSLAYLRDRHSNILVKNKNLLDSSIENIKKLVIQNRSLVLMILLLVLLLLLLIIII